MKYYLLLAGLCLAGCKKDEGASGPDAGIKGIINPAGAVTEVQAIKGTDTLRAAPTALGRFSFTSLSTGTYLVRFLPAAGYVSPPNRTVDLNSKSGLVDLDTVQVLKTGGITGRVLQAGAVTKVLLFRGGTTTDTIRTVPLDNGQFAFSNLEPDNYNLHFVTAPEFTHTSGRGVTVTAGQIINLGAIQIRLAPSALQMLINGTNTWSGSPSTSFFTDASGNNMSMHLLGTSAYGSLKIVLPADAVGPGTYTTGPGSGLQLYFEYNASQQWRAFYTTGTGTVTITRYNALAKRGSGTFSGMLAPVSSGSSTLTISNGRFENVELL